MNYSSYPWALLYGLYFYALFQVIYLVRFGGLNTTFSTFDLYLYVVGIASVLGLLYFMQKLSARRTLMLIPFVVALPFAYFGSLGGGLLGVIGIIAGGLIPFAAILPLGYLVLRRRSVPSAAAPTPPPSMAM